MSNENRLKEIEDRASLATAGPWYHRQDGLLDKQGNHLDWIADHPDHGSHSKIVVGRDALHGGTPDYAFIAAARTDVLWLVDELRKAEARAEARARQVTECREVLVEIGESLERYGEHDNRGRMMEDCDHVIWPDRPCTCGLDDALNAIVTVTKGD